MNKTELLERLRTFDFDKDQYWLAAGGAMVLYGFREETADIDLGCSTRMADKLEKQGYPTTVLKDGTRKISYASDIEIFENWRIGEVVLQNGFPVVSVDGLIEMKKALGREKDYRDVMLIKNYIEKEVAADEH